jgi:MFS family permease
MSAAVLDGPVGRPSFLRGLTTRRLDRYPAERARYLQLGLAVLATVVLYYELYVQGSVATKITATYHMSFDYFVAVLVVGNALGALASFAAGLADRWGRANLVVYGLFVTGALVLFGLPNAGSKGAYLVMFALVSIVEGALLVATPALIRDYSPQLGRAVAMGFWTMGPVLGSLIVTEVSSHTLDSHANWRFQFHVAGIVGLAVGLIAFVAMRELSPKLRDQLMVSLRDRAVIEARAAGIDPEKALTHRWRQMLRPRVMGPALGISLFLLAYYILVAFFVVFAVTVLGYSEARANALANWYWISNAVALVVAGVVSDRLRVRKPFMVVGAVVSATALAVFATKTASAGTSYYTLAVLLAIVAAGSGLAYCAWMAAFTETVESVNPAASATGLAVWGTIIRSVVTVAFLVLPSVVSAASPLVDQGPRVQQLAGQYAAQLATLQKVDPATQAALAANPGNVAAQAKAVAEIAGNGVTAADVARAGTLAAQYAAQLATLAKLDSASQVALFLNPGDVAAQARAVSEIAGNGITATDVARAGTLSAQYAQELQTVLAVDTATLLALSANPGDAAAGLRAVTQVATKFGVSAAVAQQRLLALSRVPRADIQFLLLSGPAIQAAATQLTVASQVPVADLQFLQQAGAPVEAAAGKLRAAATVPRADLTFLAANATKVQQAAKHAPGQWRNWWWVCVAGQLLFLPFIPVLRGRWSPRKAADDARLHDEILARELAALVGDGRTISPPAAAALPLPVPRDAAEHPHRRLLHIGRGRSGGH